MFLKGIQSSAGLMRSGRAKNRQEIRPSLLKPSQALDVGEVSITDGRRWFMMSWKLKCLPWPCSTGCEALLRSAMLRKFRRQRRQRQPEEGSQGPRGQNLS